jgi:hypothetical protein
LEPPPFLGIANSQRGLDQLEGVRSRGQGTDQRICTGKMEAPPGFEPGMAVLQI